MLLPIRPEAHFVLLLYIIVGDEKEMDKMENHGASPRVTARLGLGKLLR